MNSGDKAVHNNDLIHSASPYLLGHAHNPVQWKEWSADTLSFALETDRPLLVSIGYAACHWCHVMARESFENRDIADLMNRHFVCVKVDREERPDLDQLFMEACQLATGSGGWPLNAFALPDGRPFTAMTYLPPVRWLRMLEQIALLYRNQRNQLESLAEKLGEKISAGLNIQGIPPVVADDSIPGIILDAWGESIDSRYGGFGHSQKFPLPSAWECLLTLHRLTDAATPLSWVSRALEAMMKGGIHDQIGGGFCRYSVDPAWRIPHFEKMLYDNAQLISLFAHALQLIGKAEYRDALRGVFRFLNGDLRDDKGFFYASLNADSEGEEGRFYVWSRDEIEALLDPKVYAQVFEYFQISAEGNWENGRNILLPSESSRAFARRKGLDESSWLDQLGEAKKALLAARNRRVRPSRDDKVLTSWNALMISAYTDAARALNDKKMCDEAIQLAHAVMQHMSRPDGGLWRSYFRGRAAIEAFLDDYAFTARAFIDLYRVTFERSWLDRALGFVRFVMEHFSDRNSPFFFTSSDRHRETPGRLLDMDDQVMPSSNSVLAGCFFDLGRLLEEPALIHQAKEMVALMKPRILQNGPYASGWARLWARMTADYGELIVIGPRARELALEYQQRYDPFTLIAGGLNEDLPLLKHRLVEGKTMLYRCRNRVCDLPQEL